MAKAKPKKSKGLLGREGGKYTPEIRKGVQDTTALNKILNKEMFKKPTKCKG